MDKPNKDSQLKSEILSKEQSNHHNQFVKTKLQKVMLFISSSEEQLPAITNKCTIELLATQLRKYFNDQQLLFFKDHLKRDSYFKSQFFEKQLKSIFHSYLLKKQQSKLLLTTNQQNKNEEKQWKIDFIDFVQYWIKGLPQLNIFYSGYDHIVKDEIQNYSNNLSRQVSKNSSFVQQDQNKSKIKPIIDHKLNKVQSHQNKTMDLTSKSPQQISANREQKISANREQKISVNREQKELEKTIQKQNKKDIQNIIEKQSYEDQNFYQEDQNIKEHIQCQNCDDKNMENHHKNEFIESRAIRCESNSIEYFLKQFYNYYSKKVVNSMKNQSFQVLQKYYSTMSLTKFMMYCKDLKINQVSKNINIKYLQQLFKKHQNIDHALTYQKFQEAVKQFLQKAFQTEDKIKTTGYQLIGVLNKQNNQKIMKSIGIIVPMNKIVFKRTEEARSLSKVVQAKIKDQIKKSRIIQQNKNFPSLGLKNGGYAYAYQNQQNKDKNDLKNPIFMSQNDRKQQKLLQNITIPKLNKLKPSKEVDLKLNELIDDEYDPYLKRYNQKNSSYNDKNQMYQGVMKRIDQRIQNVVRKVR